MYGVSDGRLRLAARGFRALGQFVKDMDDIFYDMSDSDDCTSEILDNVHRWLAFLLR